MRKTVAAPPAKKRVRRTKRAIHTRRMDDADEDEPDVVIGGPADSEKGEGQ